MKLLTTLTLLMIWATAIGQTFPTKKKKLDHADTLFAKTFSPQGSLTYYPYTYIDTEYRYADSAGLTVIMQNSLSKWGGLLVDDSLGTAGYRDARGNKFGIVIFWSRIINETDTPLELNLNFPADSFSIQSVPGAYFKVFLPPDTMTLEKEVLGSYGLTELKSFLDSNLYKATRLQRTINPRESCMFYIAQIAYYPPHGTTWFTTRQTRAQLLLEQHDFFYDINVKGSGLIPCGQINTKN